MYIEKWYQAPRLLRENRFISVFRPGSAAQAQAEMAEKLRRQYAAQITLVECPGYDVSSTLIRQKAAAQEELAPYTGEAVAAYIREKRLYL